jgi:hypothetical protein
MPAAASLLAPSALFVAHLAATLFMAGVIWFVQVVHYPLFAAAEGGDWPRYAAAHGRRTTWVVAGPMLVELATGAALVVRRPGWLASGAAWAGLALLAVVWLSTWRLQVPRHEALARRWDAGAHRALVRTNWVRTAAWTARAALLLAALAARLA